MQALISCVGTLCFDPWDISPDGRRFLMMKEMAVSTGPRKINIVLNLMETA